MVVIMDDEDRENEGDLVMAATKVRPEDVNFMARYGRGLICLTLTRDRCRQLRLPLMVSDTDRERRTNFTLSIEAAEGITTGISAYDRAHTVRAAVAVDARPEDLRALARQQRAILAAAFAALAPGGRLVYATCSLLPEENEAQVLGLLAAEPEATALPWPDSVALPPGARRLEGGVQLLPGAEADTDGFYYACLGRRPR